MTNLECAIAILTAHREARHWTDEAVALDLLAQLGLDAAAEATNATPVVDPALVTEAEVVAAETVAKEATDKAEAARHALDAQAEREAQNPGGAKAGAADQDPAPPAPVEEEIPLTARQQRAADKAEAADKANQP